MDGRTATSTTSANPPSVEIAYKRKCIALKKRLAEVEAENELMRTRNRRGWQYIQKMRLESSLLLERLAKVTGMAEEAQAGTVNPDLRARAAAMMSNAAGLNGLAAQGENNGYIQDETEGSSDEQPPTPEERPLRVKRSRKSNINLEPGADDEPANQETAPESGDALPRLAPAPSQQELTSTFRVHRGSNGSIHERSHTPANGEKEGREGGQERSQIGTGQGGTTPMDMDTKEPKVEG